MKRLQPMFTFNNNIQDNNNNTTTKDITNMSSKVTQETQDVKNQVIPKKDDSEPEDVEEVPTDPLVPNSPSLL